MKKIICMALAAITLAFAGCNENDPSAGHIFKDLNLSSGTRWAEKPEPNPNNADGLFTIEKALARFGGNIPTKAQWEELLSRCSFEKNAEGILLTVNTKNGNKMRSMDQRTNDVPEEIIKILLPMVGHFDCNDPELEKEIAYLWTSSIDPVKQQYWYVAITESDYEFNSVAEACAEMSVLLVNQSIEGGALCGVFSVAPDKKVRFSKGNLQASFNLRSLWGDPYYYWGFAEKQWEYLSAEDNIKALGSLEDGGLHYMDLLGWGTGKDPRKYLLTSDYSSFDEWGDNSINNGGEIPGMWRTLKADEWLYLIHDRDNAEERIGYGTVDGVFGFILLPDEWTMPKNIASPFLSMAQNGMSWDPESTMYLELESKEHKEDNKYSIDDWKAMQANGAVFLPAGGKRLDKDQVLQQGEYGYYWSCDKFTAQVPYDTEKARVLFVFNADGAGMADFNAYYGCSVRLVMDVK